jgi:hypothetical protein
LAAGIYRNLGRPGTSVLNEKVTATRQSSALAPIRVCIGAGLAVAFTSVLVWLYKTGDLVCLDDWFSLFYLRFVAQVYYAHTAYLTDIVVPGGIAYYPWLQFISDTWAARGVGASSFAVDLIWRFLSAVDLSSGLYLVFRCFLRRPWTAAGCNLFCLCDYGFATAHPLIDQLRMLGAALWLPSSALVTIPWGLLLQWRVPDPGLDLPYYFRS